MVAAPNANSAVTSNSNALRPRLVTIRDAMRISGISRSKIYMLLGASDVVARKCGSRTLIDLVSLEEYLESLPKVVIKAAESKTAMP